jgi:hypothetical protein
MSTMHSLPHRGFIVELDNIPMEFLARLEREGLASMTARTVDGVYLEPRTNLASIIDLIERAGATVHGFRAAGAQASWHQGARPAASSRQRLTNRRSAVWLPTLPAA